MAQKPRQRSASNRIVSVLQCKRNVNEQEYDNPPLLNHGARGSDEGIHSKSTAFARFVWYAFPVPDSLAPKRRATGVGSRG